MHWLVTVAFIEASFWVRVMRLNPSENYQMPSYKAKQFTHGID
jgi:hypothetical protein